MATHRPPGAQRSSGFIRGSRSRCLQENFASKAAPSLCSAMRRLAGPAVRRWRKKPQSFQSVLMISEHANQRRLICDEAVNSFCCCRRPKPLNAAEESERDQKKAAA